jgi:hypothetical protein
MASYNKFDCFVRDLALGVHNLAAASDTVKAALTNNNPAGSPTVETLAELPDIANGNGYTTGGEDAQQDVSFTGGVLTLTAVDVVWTASGAGLATFRYVYIYNDTPSSPADPLIGYWDYGSSIAPAAGETFTLDFGSSVLTIT